ncbi:MAG: Gfo/Idh/MocA family oxidoreductase [Thermoguttaceae bacterium]|jgi:predicted dehydrogenase
MEPLRVVSIGGWGHWAEVFDSLVGFDEARLVATAPAYAGEDLGGLRRHALATPDVQPFDDFKAMLHGVRPEVAVVSTRLDRIVPVAAAAAEAGCHLICEKPLALDVAGLGRLHEAVRRGGRRLLAMHTMRGLPAFLAARQAVGDGRIGRVVAVNARKSYKWGTRPEWFGDRAVYGGTIPWIGIHALDMIRFVTGEWFASVAAAQGNLAHPDRPGCEDHAAIVARLSGGGSATASIDFCRPAGAATHGDDWIRVVGSRGVLEANASQGWCRLIEGEAGATDLALPPPDPMFRNFLRCLRQGLPYALDTEEAFALSHVALLARDAADRGAVVAVDRPAWAASSQCAGNPSPK